MVIEHLEFTTQNGCCLSVSKVRLGREDKLSKTLTNQKITFRND